jgi:hypothetical protein
MLSHSTSDARTQTLGPIDGRMKVIDPLLSIGPSTRIQVLRWVDSEIWVRAPRRVLVGATVQLEPRQQSSLARYDIANRRTRNTRSAFWSKRVSETTGASYRAVRARRSGPVPRRNDRQRQRRDHDIGEPSNREIELPEFGVPWPGTRWQVLPARLRLRRNQARGESSSGQRRARATPRRLFIQRRLREAPLRVDRAPVGHHRARRQ